MTQDISAKELNACTSNPSADSQTAADAYYMYVANSTLCVRPTATTTAPSTTNAASSTAAAGTTAAGATTTSDDSGSGGNSADSTSAGLATSKASASLRHGRQPNLRCLQLYGQLLPYLSLADAPSNMDRHNDIQALRGVGPWIPRTSLR